jgi:predicted neutral ceramidase superfamily lipid hydrolase
MNFKLIHESAKNEREHNLREDNASYEQVDPAAGLQPAKKMVVMDPADDRTRYIYPDGSNVEEWYGV